MALTVLTSSGGGFGNTNQYRDVGNGTGNQGGYNCDLSHVHHTIFKMMEPHYRKFRGTINVKNLMEAGRLSHINGTFPWIKHNWRNNKSIICWNNMLGWRNNPKCTYEHVPNQKNSDNEWINNVCDVFQEPFKWITNHNTPFPGDHTGGNGGPRGGNDGNSGNGGSRGGNERYGGKKNKNDNTGQAGGGGSGKHYGPQGGGSGRKRQI